MGASIARAGDVSKPSSAVCGAATFVERVHLPVFIRSLYRSSDR